MINNITFPNLGIDITVNRVAFSVFGMEVYWYGIIIATGLILGFIYAIHEAKRTQLSQDDLLNMFLIAIPVAIICARLYFVAFSWDMYKDDLWSIFDLRSGGIAVYGSLIGAGISVLMYCYIKKINLGMVLDIMAIGFLIGQAVGRWGNFVNGEAFGCVTNLPWGMSIKADGIDIAKMVHPTFLYESLWNAMCIGVLVIYKKYKKFDGEIFFGYISLYGLGRFWIEGLRIDSLYLGNIRVSQLVALVSVFVGILLIIVGRYRKRKSL
ncbi:MAG: prolipoprotein diacylglyceryl transferase [Oscillospiraceae bacterium]